MTNKILLVDDEPNVLQGYKRHLRKKYDLELAIGGDEALQIFRAKGPFAVVVSDMQMPEMLGVELLSKIAELNDQTVRIMLTGNADQKTAVDAVNEGNIFRFLSKPCTPEHLSQTLDAALEHYQLITAEAELLNKTLAGSVRMLTQVLSMAMPEAFGMSSETRSLVRGVAVRAGIGPLWQLEIAGMLMRVGCVSLPQDVLKDYLSGGVLRPESQRLIDETPQLGYNLISSIPRLEPVADLVRQQNDRPDDSTPIGSRILRAVGDYQRYHTDGRTVGQALKRLDSTRYDPEIVAILHEVLNVATESRDLSINQLKDGMVLDGNVTDLTGRVLLASGTEIHQSIVQKLSVFRQNGAGVKEPIHVLVPLQVNVPGTPTAVS